MTSTSLTTIGGLALLPDGPARWSSRTGAVSTIAFPEAFTGGAMSAAPVQCATADHAATDQMVTDLYLTRLGSPSCRPPV